MSLLLVGESRVVSLGDRLAHIRSVVDRALSDGVETMHDLQQRIRRELRVEATQESLQAIWALSRVDDTIEVEIIQRSLLLHFAVLLSARELWEPVEIDPETLRAALELIAPLQELEGRVDEKFAASIGEVDRLRRETIEKLHASLRLPDHAMHAAAVVGPELLRLAEAACRGTLAEVAPTLSESEIEAVTAAFAPSETGAPRPDRVQIDALALRTLMERDLAEFRALRPANGGSPFESAHHAARRRLEAERASNEFVARRLEALRSERWLKTRTPNRPLDLARRSLFTVYVELSKTLEAHPRILERPSDKRSNPPLKRRTKILEIVAAAMAPFGGAGLGEDRDEK